MAMAITGGLSFSGGLNLFVPNYTPPGPPVYLLYAAGQNNAGQLGFNNGGAATYKSSPTQVGALTTWSDISVNGGSISFGITSDGKLWTWGDTSSISGLNSSASFYRSSPTQVGALTTWSSIQVYTHAMAIKTDGTLWAWGRNTDGQLGDGTSIDKSSPVQIGAGTNWASVAINDVSTFAIKTDGTLWAWGYNGQGQLGQGDRTNVYSPVQVGSGTTWSKIAAGGRSFRAIKTDGTLWTCGGDTFSGQLGINATGYRSSPVQVGADTTWSTLHVSKGGAPFSVYAIKTDGTLWAWGYNQYGELGFNNAGAGTYKSSPTQIGSGTTWSKVFFGGSSVMATKTDGTLWAWGYNVNGALGVGDATNKSSPVQVGSSSNWYVASPSNNHSLYITVT